ncbi:FAD-dependent oxidoreductase [Pseudonocardia sp. GCM10023141]|uniref:FAD-dependent oxidoreductase n=1 Tax=Pseudonocardia sp. GCM10023141 TaxID=3252653 RepID=UPI00362131FA
MVNNERTTCLVVGGGPAGLVLGLLMARGGVDVTVLEKHEDFLRDFRGDTVHASTLTLLDELGLGERFAAIPQRAMTRMRVQLDAGTAELADMRRLPGAHQHVAMVPQWDFLDLIADAAAQEPTFALRRNAEFTGLLRDGGRVVGARYRDRVDGSEHEIRASVTVACDGRGSAVAAAAGMRARSFGVPMDVWWFRLPRLDNDPSGAALRLSTGHFAVLIDRGDYWQVAYLIKKGSDGPLRAAGIEAFRRRIAGLLPWMSERLAALESFDDVKLLDVELNRMRRWDADGLLLIGDAAHTMSPVGGVGINLAVADAVAAARLLAPALRSGGIVPRALLHRVQRRRYWPTVVVQSVQKLAHRALIAGPVLENAPATVPAGPMPTFDDTVDPKTVAPTSALPLPLRLLQRFPVLQGVPARLVALGPLPEHAPDWARRPEAALRG